MTWQYHNVDVTEIPEGVIGFVYEITSKIDGRRYFGKKNFYFTKTKQVKGKKKRYKVEELKADVEKYGAENFNRDILYYCKTKGMMSYLELREQMDHRVLEHPELYYNAQVHVRVHRSHVKT